MVDFKKLRESKSKPKPKDPREIFNSLPKPPGINDLYASQAEVLDAWFGRRTERDLVIKLHTGGGKTLVALLMAQSVMNEVGEAVIYLAPTNQLVDQVIAKSQEYGIPTVRYVQLGARCRQGRGDRSGRRSRRALFGARLLQPDDRGHQAPRGLCRLGRPLPYGFSGGRARRIVRRHHER